MQYTPLFDGRFLGSLLPHPHASKAKKNSRAFWKYTVETIHKQNIFLRTVNNLLRFKLDTILEFTFFQRLSFLFFPARSIKKYNLILTIQEVWNRRGDL
jgi:hypothetical protein